MKKSLTLLLFFCSSTLFAHEEMNKWEHYMFGGYDHEFIIPGVFNTELEPTSGPCAELKLEESQKTKLKEVYFKFKEDNIDLESRAQKAHLAYEKMIINTESNGETAKSASQEMISSLSNIMQAHANYKNEIMFEILKPNQRALAHACTMYMLKLKNFSWEKHSEHWHSKN